MPIVFSRVGFEWPNGQSVFNDVNVSLERKIYGLVGVNGVGKTTFARLLTGELAPTSGHIRSSESIFYFQQDEPQPNGSTLSGGEWTRFRFSQIMQSQASFLVLDEPTNHLDSEGREIVNGFVESFAGGILIISHDRSLLEKADQILELTAQGISVFSGAYSFYEEEKTKEREHLFSQLQKAKGERAKAKRSRQEKVQRQEKRQRKGKADALKGGMPKILIGARKRTAQQTLGRIDSTTSADLAAAVSEAYLSYEKLKIDPLMYASIPAVNMPTGKLLIEAEGFNYQYGGKLLWQTNLTFAFKGPARIAVRGLNGSGKSTLLNLLDGKSLAGKSFGKLRLGNVKVALLDQSYSQLDRSLSVFENIRNSSPIEESELRNLLAMFLFKGNLANQKVGSLSGGESLRAALAKVLLGQPLAELLILDEPTNNLDLPNIKFLESLLNQYKGGLIMVSHDESFLANVNLTEEIELK